VTFSLWSLILFKGHRIFPCAGVSTSRVTQSCGTIFFMAAVSNANFSKPCLVPSTAVDTSLYMVFLQFHWHECNQYTPTKNKQTYSTHHAGSFFQGDRTVSEVVKSPLGSMGSLSSYPGGNQSQSFRAQALKGKFRDMMSVALCQCL
jgi:hypothetical protein